MNRSHQPALLWSKNQHGPFPVERLGRVEQPTSLITDAVQRIVLRDTAYGLAARGEYGQVVQQGPEICDQLNSKLQGWSNYFCLGTRQAIFRALDRYIYERVRDFLERRHKVAGRGTRRFSYEAVYAIGLMRLEASR